MPHEKALRLGREGVLLAAIHEGRLAGSNARVLLAAMHAGMGRDGDHTAVQLENTCAGMLEKKYAQGFG